MNAMWAFVGGLVFCALFPLCMWLYARHKQRQKIKRYLARKQAVDAKTKAADDELFERYKSHRP